jgi:hypothetical protein
MVAKAKRSKDTTKTMFTKSVNGANQLKKYIQEIQDITNGIQSELSADLESPAANVVFNPICRPEQNALAQMCASEHKQFVCELIGASNDCCGGEGCVVNRHEMKIQDILQELEDLRKMIVNAKQEKKTDIVRIKAAIQELYTVLPRAEFEEFGGGFVEISTPDNHPTIVKMRELITRRKQNYKTVRRQILKQVDRKLAELRKYIVGYKTEAETVVGRVIHHAEQCRAFIRACRKHALIEFAASEWWRATHYCWEHCKGRQAMEVDDVASVTMCEYKFSLTPLPLPLPKWSDDNDDDKCSQFIITTTTTTTTMTTTAAGGMEDEEREEEQEVARYTVTKEFEDIILTQEAIEAFEWEEAQMWYYTQQQQQEAHGYDDDAMEE